MNILSEFECNLLELDNFAKKLANYSNIGDIYLLKGDLGAGKTTFARSFINSLFDKNKVTRPDIINSPSFPIMINYHLIDFEIEHYDLYRLIDKNELLEIGIFENAKEVISIIEWPDIILKNFKLKNYFLIQLEIININYRSIKIFHSTKKEF